MSTSTNTQLDVVTLDNEISRGVASAPNMWICNDVIKLSTADRDILLNPVGYLNDSIIAAAQDLLKNKSVSQGGFQDTVLGLTCNFQIETEEFVQILFNGRNHWLVISTVGAVDDSEVFVYDSVHVCVNQTIKNQIAALLATKRKEIKLKFMDVQIQSGGYDCGLFAIAFATAIVLGNEPGKFFFDQSVMRRHLKNCLESENMSLFPVKRTRRGEGKVKSEDSIEVFCECRMPPLPGVDMVQCSSCEEWFHVSCVSVPSKAMECTKEQWFCQQCRQ